MAWVGDRRSPSPIACVFESGDEHGGQIVDAFSSAKRKSDELDRRLLSWSFEDKRKIWGLQAADLLAYEAARQAVLNSGYETIRYASLFSACCDVPGTTAIS